VSLGLEALYVTKGAKFEGFATDQFGQVVSTADGHLRLKYVVIPLLARVSLPRVGNATPYVVAGPSAGIGLSAKSEFSVRKPI
jgi:hypothetical protein